MNLIKFNNYAVFLHFFPSNGYWLILSYFTQFVNLTTDIFKTICQFVTLFSNADRNKITTTSTNGTKLRKTVLMKRAINVSCIKFMRQLCACAYYSFAFSTDIHLKLFLLFFGGYFFFFFISVSLVHIANDCECEWDVKYE